MIYWHADPFVQLLPSVENLWIRQNMFSCPPNGTTAYKYIFPRSLVAPPIR